jgi:hypothetical protein
MENSYNDIVSGYYCKILGIGKKIASKKNCHNFNMEYSRRRIRYDQWQKKIHHWSHSSSDNCHLGMDFALNIGK